MHVPHVIGSGGVESVDGVFTLYGSVGGDSTLYGGVEGESSLHGGVEGRSISRGGVGGSTSHSQFPVSSIVSLQYILLGIEQVHLSCVCERNLPTIPFKRHGLPCKTEHLSVQYFQFEEGGNIEGM